MIIKKQTITEEQIVGQTLEFQHAPFEVKINSNVEISKQAYRQSEIEAPVETQTVMQAASLIQELFLAHPELSVHAQANTTKERVKMLLE